MLLVNNMLCNIFLKLINPNFDCKTIVNDINDTFLLNTLQKLIIKNIIDYIIKNKRKMHFKINAQLLLYLCRKIRV